MNVFDLVSDKDLGRWYKEAPYPEVPEDRCLICGRAVKLPSAYFVAVDFLACDDLLLDQAGYDACEQRYDETGDGSPYTWPIGPDCAKHVPREYLLSY